MISLIPQKCQLKQSLSNHTLLIQPPSFSNPNFQFIDINPSSVTFSNQPKFSIISCLSNNHPQISPHLPSANSKNDAKSPFGALILSTQKKVSIFMSKNAVKLLFGSVILVGSLNCKSISASPMQKKDVNLEESVDEEEMYVKLLAQEPRNLEALKSVVNLKMRKGKTKEALKYVEKLIDIEPEQVEWRLLQALCYEMMKQFGKAKRLFKDVLKDNPLLLRALHGLAMVMHKNHEGTAVFDMLYQALELAQRETRVTEERNIKILIAQMHLVKGELDVASEMYQELITENPRDFRPYLCQGIIYSLQDKKKEADEQFEMYKNLVPEEFPQRGFLEDVVLAAKSESKDQLEKEFKTHFSYK